MIDLSTQTIFCDGIPSGSVKMDSSTQQLLKCEEPSLQHGKYGFLPMQRSSRYTYCYSFKLKNVLQWVAVVRVQQNERLFIAFILILLCVCEYQRTAFFVGRVLSNNSPEEWSLLTFKVICTAPFGEIQYKLSDNARPMIL